MHYYNSLSGVTSLRRGSFKSSFFSFYATALIYKNVVDGAPLPIRCPPAVWHFKTNGSNFGEPCFFNALSSTTHSRPINIEKLFSSLLSSWLPPASLPVIIAASRSSLVDIWPVG